ncbi:MAG: FAD-dependent oxidoreductase [Bacteroidetes bacterium]|nr:FAD-dependent oxidoreductase [Bacteroidota bacterium]MCL5026365.1 FAD-dependent oxidoreductase [Chloroflexota bacterium]
MALQVWPHTEVLVAGGGPTGIVAAIAAGLAGARTTLVEQHGFLGGEATTALNIHGFHSNNETHIVRGIPWEIIDRLKKMHAACEMRFSEFRNLSLPMKMVRDVAIDKEAFKHLTMEMLEDAGVKVLLHTFVSDVVIEDDALRGLVVENKSGRVFLQADRVVDCTGDGDVAARAGAPFEQGRASDGTMQPLSLMFTLNNVDLERAVDTVGTRRAVAIDPEPWMSKYQHFMLPLSQWKAQLQRWFPELPEKNLFTAFTGNALRKGEVNGATGVHVPHIDATDAEQLSRAEILGRKYAWRMAHFMQENVPGFENSYLLSTSAHIGVRETRRILGEHYLTYDEVIEARRNENVVALGGFFVDIHDYEGRSEEGFVPSKGIIVKDGGYYDIPYGTLVPKRVDNLLVGGRCHSASHEAQASTRVMGTCMGMGQAAGAAAALSLKQGVSPRELEVKGLQQLLLQQGAFLGERFLEAEPPAEHPV